MIIVATILRVHRHPTKKTGTLLLTFKFNAMKFKKLILPIVAIVFAIGMAFATTNFTLEPKGSPDVPNDLQATMFVRVNNNWHEVDVDCEDGDSLCQVTFSEDPEGNSYQVYNSQNINDPAFGSGSIKIIDGPVPSN